MINVCHHFSSDTSAKKKGGKKRGQKRRQKKGGKKRGPFFKVAWAHRVCEAAPPASTRSTRIKAGAASGSADHHGVAEAVEPAAAALLPAAPGSAVAVITAAAEAAAIEAVEATMAPAAPTPLPPDGPGGQSSHNPTSEQLSRVQTAIQDVLNHHYFNDLAAHLGLDDKIPDRFNLLSQKPRWTEATYMQSMEKDKQAVFWGNFLWCNLSYSTTPGVPVNRKGIAEMMERDFEQPTAFPEPIQMAAATSTWNAGDTPNATTWQRITPDELVHAFWLAVARDVTDPNTSVQVLLQWRRHLLSTPFTLVAAVGDQVLFRSLRMREDAVQRAKVLQRSALQRIYEVDHRCHICSAETTCQVLL